MGTPPAHGRLPRALAIAAAALALGTAVPAAAASDPPAKAATAKRAKAETRYCVLRDRAGAAATEKLCKTRARWVHENGFDPIRHLQGSR